MPQATRGTVRSRRPGRDRGAPPAGHRSDRPGALRRRRPGRPRPGRQRRRAGPVDRLGGAAHGPAGAAGLPGHERRGTRRGPAGPSSSGAGPAPGHPCRGSPPRSCSTRTTPSYREESAPTYSAVDVLLERARRQGAPCVLASPVPPVALAALDGDPDGGAPGPRGAGGLADARAGGPPRRRPAHRDVLRGVRPPRPGRARRSRRRGHAGPAGVRLQPDRRCPAPGLPPLRRAGPLRALRRRGRPAARRGGAALPALRRDAAGRVRRLRPAAHEDAAGRREPAARGARGAARGRRWARWPVPVAGVPSPRCRPTPVLVGTEAVLHRVRHAAAVAFLDIDLHLLAPRLSATEDTLALFVRAARLVGARGTRAAVGAGAGPDPGARPSGPAGGRRRASRQTVLAEEVAIRRASGAAAVRRAGAGVGHPGPRLRRRPGAGGGWPGDAGRRLGVRRWATTASSCGPPAHGAAVRPLGPGAPAAGAGSARRGGSRRSLSRPAGPGRRRRGPPVGWGDAQPHHPPVRRPRAEGAHPRRRGHRRRGGQPGRLHDRDDVRRARHGLAANQVGVQRRIFVYDVGEGARTIINPRIVESDGEWVFDEGCLSVPGLSWEIVRPNAVHLVGLDLDGNEVSIEATELEGRVFQHELDHLDGILLVERLERGPAQGGAQDPAQPHAGPLPVGSRRALEPLLALSGPRRRLTPASTRRPRVACPTVSGWPAWRISAPRTWPSPPLRALVEAGHDIALCVTRPDRRRGRGGDDARRARSRRRPPSSASPVTHDMDDVADRRGRAGRRRGLRPDHPRPAARRRCPMVNLHFSLLPRWRGAAPVERAILAGDHETGRLPDEGRGGTRHRSRLRGPHGAARRRRDAGRAAGASWSPSAARSSSRRWPTGWPGCPSPCPSTAR